jgi:hypothetical protein
MTGKVETGKYNQAIKRHGQWPDHLERMALAMNVVESSSSDNNSRMCEADDDDGGAMLLPDDYDASDAPENMDLDEELPLHHLPMDFNNPEHTRDLGSFHAIKFYEYAARYGAQSALEYLVKNSQFRGDIKGEMGKIGTIPNHGQQTCFAATHAKI